MKKNLLPVLLSATIFLNSCATIFTGTKNTVYINSYPQGAKIEIDGIERGITPAPIKMKKGSNGQTVVLKKEGYVNKVFQPETTFNAVSLLNFFGIIGWGVDAITGAYMKYDPKSYEITLETKN